MVCQLLHAAHSLLKARRAVLVVDMIESVRLMEIDQVGITKRWLSFVDHVKTAILPGTGGRLVKHLGDGLMLEFEEARAAATAALAIQQANRQFNEGLSQKEQIRYRMGIEESEVLIGADDIYGHGVNLASRLSQLARADEIVISASVCDQLTATIDADIEDLGECYLKHVQEPMRAYRISPPGLRPLMLPATGHGDLRPTIVVIPFSMRGSPIAKDFIGEILAEELIKRLSWSPYLNVISRLSTTAFRGRSGSLEPIRSKLSANYILSGAYSVDRDRILVDAELTETKGERIVWSERLEDGVTAILSEEQELMGKITARVISAMTSHELERASKQTLPTLESYTILMAAITLLHRNSLSDFVQSRDMLEALVDRYPRHAVPRAWIAKWHVFHSYQGWSEDPQKDTSLALASVERALDADPQSSLTLAMSGLVRTHMSKELDVAQECYDLAVQMNPNDSLAWLLRGVLFAFKGDGKEAVDNTQRAVKLSPLDPHGYYYDCLAATAHIANHQYDDAIRLAHRSKRANKFHASTFRALAVAQWLFDQHDDACKTVKQLLKLEPKLTINGYLKRSPAAAYDTGREWADALRAAGVPN